MKRAILLITMTFSAPLFAAYDFVIQDGDNFGAKTLTGSQTMLVTGGGGDFLDLFDYSKADIQNTSPLISQGNGGIWQIFAGGRSAITIIGGQIHQLDAGTYSNAYISGGRIDEIWSYYSLPDPSRITLVCKPGYQITYTNSLATNISGNWRDGSAFSIKLVNPSGNSSVLSNMTIIPEPLTLVLLGMGGLLMRRK